MYWLNYHHLLYFWMVAREGSIVRAAEVLHVSQPTISTQLRALEEAVGHKLFRRKGRLLEPTETGHFVFQYADEIFALGKELQDGLQSGPLGRSQRLVVGISDVVPKLIAHRLLAPALALDPPVRIVCLEGKTDQLLAELSIQGLDLVITDSPAAGRVRVKAFNHLLGECGLSFYAAASVADQLKGPFPACLDGAPMLLPTDHTLLRRSLDQWFEAVGVQPRIVGEFDDSALVKVFGEHGSGVFTSPTVIEREIVATHHVRLLGRVGHIRERFYAISVERRLKHPAVLAISREARNWPSELEGLGRRA